MKLHGFQFKLESNNDISSGKKEKGGNKSLPARRTSLRSRARWRLLMPVLLGLSRRVSHPSCCAYV
jgi:hypothetical protein